MPSWIEPLRRAQLDLSLTGLARQLRTPKDWRTFAEHHVFAVWDFMSLLKRLQREVTGFDVPWLPAADRHVARFINEMVLAEESDDDGAGGFTDHFTLYRCAMREAGADCGPIKALLAGLRARQPWRDALAASGAPAPAAQFVADTLAVAEDGAPHEVAAVFFFGRESLLPQLFADLLRQVTVAAPELKTLRYYFARHITLDGEEHGPMAERLLLGLCGNHPQRRLEAQLAAKRALEARAKLWQAVVRGVRRP